MGGLGGVLMSIYDRETKQKTNRSKQRDQKRDQRAAERAQRTSVDILGIDGDNFLKCLEAACSIGGALRLGLSRDGGAYAVGIYGDGDPYTEYVGAGEDVNQYFANLTEYFHELRDASPET